MFFVYASRHIFYSNVCLFAVIDGATLRIDDRLRVAKERREEAERQQGKKIDTQLKQEVITVRI